LVQREKKWRRRMILDRGGYQYRYKKNKEEVLLKNKDGVKNK